jgi:hypothetical protein
MDLAKRNRLVRRDGWNQPYWNEDERKAKIA